MNAHAMTSTAQPSAPSFAALASQSGDASLTRVSLAYVAHRINLYLRFGEPAYHVNGTAGGAWRRSGRRRSSAASAGRPTTTVRCAGSSW